MSLYVTMFLMNPSRPQMTELLVVECRLNNNCVRWTLSIVFWEKRKYVYRWMNVFSLGNEYIISARQCDIDTNKFQCWFRCCWTRSLAWFNWGWTINRYYECQEWSNVIDNQLISFSKLESKTARPATSQTASCVCITTTVEPNSIKTSEFALTWHMPEIKFGLGQKQYSKYVFSTR